MRIGIFGGTFDPPHLGHMILADEAWVQLKLDRLLFVLTPDPPHKQNQIISPLQYRLEMLTAALASNDTFDLSRIEIDRPGPHYAVDTLRLLKIQFPAAKLIYLIGGDSLDSLPDWHEADQFVEICDEIGVMQRPENVFDLDQLNSRLPGVVAKVQLLHAPLLEISSRQIRRRIREGRPFRYYLSPAVKKIIKTHDLYRLPTNQ